MVGCSAGFVRWQKLAGGAVSFKALTTGTSEVAYTVHAVGIGVTVILLQLTLVHIGAIRRRAVRDVGARVSRAAAASVAGARSVDIDAHRIVSAVDVVAAGGVDARRRTVLFVLARVSRAAAACVADFVVGGSGVDARRTSSAVDGSAIAVHTVIPVDAHHRAVRGLARVSIGALACVAGARSADIEAHGVPTSSTIDALTSIGVFTQRVGRGLRGVSGAAIAAVISDAVLCASRGWGATFCKCRALVISELPRRYLVSVSEIPSEWKSIAYL